MKKELTMNKEVKLKYLICRCQDKETDYDKNFEKEYWKFIWSDGIKGEGSLYKSQMEGVKIIS